MNMPRYFEAVIRFCPRPDAPQTDGTAIANFLATLAHLDKGLQHRVVSILEKDGHDMGEWETVTMRFGEPTGVDRSDTSFARQAADDHVRSTADTAAGAPVPNGVVTKGRFANALASAAATGLIENAEALGLKFEPSAEDPEFQRPAVSDEPFADDPIPWQRRRPGQKGNE